MDIAVEFIEIAQVCSREPGNFSEGLTYEVSPTVGWVTILHVREFIVCGNITWKCV